MDTPYPIIEPIITKYANTFFKLELVDQAGLDERVLPSIS